MQQQLDITIRVVITVALPRMGLALVFTEVIHHTFRTMDTIRIMGIDRITVTTADPIMGAMVITAGATIMVADMAITADVTTVADMAITVDRTDIIDPIPTGRTDDTRGFKNLIPGEAAVEL
jgi:hypothetical protein